MIGRVIRVGAWTAALVLTWSAATGACADEPQFPGPTKDGFLLPNGWRLTPAGRHVEIPNLPLNIHPLSDSRHALVTSDGFTIHQISLIDLDEAKLIDRVPGIQSWFGLAGTKDETLFWWSGGGSNVLYPIRLVGLDLQTSTRPAKVELLKKDVNADRQFRSGLALDEERGRLYSLDVEQGTIAAIDPNTGKVEVEGKVGLRPYDVAIGPGGRLLYVSDWADRSVLAVDPEALRVLAKISVGEHPNQIAVHPRDERLFVACANSNTVSVIDAKRGVVIETIYTTLFPKAPEGSTPDAVALSPDGGKLYVANADNNCIAVVDVTEPAKSVVEGFIPTGWYPTSVAATPDGKRLLVGVGKGLQTKPNAGARGAGRVEEPKEGEGRPRRNLPYAYIGTTLVGALSIVPIPDEAQLAEYTAQVYRNCPYSDDLLSGSKYEGKTAIPTRIGDASPIKYVIYVIKENRTYDQILGDMPEGNGDPTLCMFGEEVTPNHHKLAREFVLLDNLYCNGQVSRDGHPWSTMAYNTDWTARDWMLTYSGRAGIDDDEGANLSRSPSGYIWDACKRAGVSYRSYGEYGNRVSQPDGTVRMEARVPGLVGHMNLEYGIPHIPGQRARDTRNVEIFLKEFHEFVEKGTLPRFIIMSLGEDHTSGTTPGAFTPEACVASNDLALGRLVEAVSRSKVWPETAIFVIEDDAQNGPDHVDAHRTVGFVISPYAKRKFVDSTQYSTASMLRTMELILGLDPLSQYDAAATAMFRSFTDEPDLTPYEHEPARIDLEAKNTPLAYGAERSAQMDFSEYDLIDDFELNEILWRAVKGVDAPMPPAVRRAVAYRTGVRAGAEDEPGGGNR